MGTVSVVMIDSAADSQLASRRSASACGSPVTMRSTGSGSMITPVENGRTCSALHSSAPAAARQTSMARFRPSAPVPALALPVFTTKARTGWRKCLLASSTGAAQKRFFVNTPATADPGASRMTSRSLRFALRTPAMAIPNSKPATACSDAPSGARRFTAMAREPLAYSRACALRPERGAGQAHGRSDMSISQGRATTPAPVSSRYRKPTVADFRPQPEGGEAFALTPPPRGLAAWRDGASFRAWHRHRPPCGRQAHGGVRCLALHENRHRRARGNGSEAP